MTYLLLFFLDPRKNPNRSPELVREFALDPVGEVAHPTTPPPGSYHKFLGARALAGTNSGNQALGKTVRPGIAEWFGRKVERLIHPRSAVCRVALGAKVLIGF
jgi:hypothetical protein